ncbi:MAG: M20/M25/M40 family metallo-hydrolase [Chloroflexia bacterium]|nr:M20/M25/M40 family metallo-hydrolase [Chloroflexia bacterium]
MRLIAQPSISAQDIGVRECAALEMELLQKAGLEPRLLETSGHPMVYAEWLDAPGKPTILFYGHYDVQPPDPLDLWLSPPFESEIRDGRIYGRGVADNKAHSLCGLSSFWDSPSSVATVPLGAVEPSGRWSNSRTTSPLGSSTYPRVSSS